MAMMPAMEPKTPAVECGSCHRSWNSASMAEGLRLLGACPRCGGALTFAEAEKKAEADVPERPTAAVAPHLVLGIPQRY
jgi:hypothetical protein